MTVLRVRPSASLGQMAALTEPMRISETGFEFAMMFFLLEVKGFGALPLTLNRRRPPGPDAGGIAKPAQGTGWKSDPSKKE